MFSRDPSPDGFLARHDGVIRASLVGVRGSSPRDGGTEMLVALGGSWGTIGGGRLEYMVIERAREMLAGGELADRLDIPLGPEIGQCCGGRVQVSLARMSVADKAAVRDAARRDAAALPHVHVLGAGHVGRALADLFQHLPVRCILVDSRADELALCDARVETRHSAIPEFDIKTAPPGSAFIVLTHDHALDFLLASEALARGDAAYVGLIGSATKRAKFERWCREADPAVCPASLVCPIGAQGSRDKRPAVIAAFVAAEVIAALTGADAVARQTEQSGPPPRGPLKGRGGAPRGDAPRRMGGGAHRDQPELHL